MVHFLVLHSFYFPSRSTILKFVSFSSIRISLKIIVLIPISTQGKLINYCPPIIIYSITTPNFTFEASFTLSIIIIISIHFSIQVSLTLKVIIIIDFFIQAYFTIIITSLTLIIDTPVNISHLISFVATFNFIRSFCPNYNQTNFTV